MGATKKNQTAGTVRYKIESVRYKNYFLFLEPKNITGVQRGLAGAGGLGQEVLAWHVI